jgi:hypothetical protein
MTPGMQPGAKKVEHHDTASHARMNFFVRYKGFARRSAGACGLADLASWLAVPVNNVGNVTGKPSSLTLHATFCLTLRKYIAGARIRRLTCR